MCEIKGPKVFCVCIIAVLQMKDKKVSHSFGLSLLLFHHCS